MRRLWRQETPNPTACRSLAAAALTAWAAPFWVLGLLTACGLSAARPAAQAAAFDHSHSAWDQVLQDHVYPDGDGTVFDYRALKGRRAPFDVYLGQLSSVSSENFQSWSRAQRLAFLINAYNAFTVEWVVRHWPVKSIRDTADDPWAVEFIELLGEKRSLNQIEHVMIRPVFQEPLVHFAVNCASRGCPPLRGEAYLAGRLKEQLEDAARTFLRHSDRNRIEGEVLYLSSIFKWYPEDFKERYGGVLPFLAGRMTDDQQVAQRMRQGRLEVRYLDYDWSINAPDSTASSSRSRP